MQSRLPRDVYGFLRAHIRSIGQLEVLLLLSRDPARTWTVNEVNRELRMSDHAARKHLELLRDQQIVREEAGSERRYHFAPQDPNLPAVVRRLDGMFHQWVASIVDAIYAPREDSIRQFADAFRLKRDDRDDHDE